MYRKKGDRFKSGLERDFAQTMADNHIPYKYESTKLKFIQPEKKRSYTVDFDIGSLYIETKGRLTVADRQKMLLVKEQHPDKVIVMVFDRSYRKISKGSPTSYADWCTKNGFIYFDIKQIKEDPQCILRLTKTKRSSSSRPVMKKPPR